MGNLTLAREDARAERVLPWLDAAWQDLRYGLRSAAHQPGFAAVAIATLAAAIGLNTTLFTIFNALALAPWPVADPAGVVTIHNTSAADVRVRGGGAPGGFSFDEADYFRAHARTSDGIHHHPKRRRRSDAGRRRHARVLGQRELLLAARREDGARPWLCPDEDVSAAPAAVAVLSYGYWTPRPRP